MEYQLGDTLRVDGDIYRVTGKILYRNLNDNCTWFEYKIRPNQGSGEKWLSYDASYAEYSLSTVVHNVSTGGYHVVDKGVEVVDGAWGDVDVSKGDSASFTEYEDPTEEFIISSEVWDDGEEFSKGYYLDENEVEYLSSGTGGYQTNGFQSSGYSSSGYSGTSYGGSSYSGYSRNNNSVIAAIGVVVFIIFGLVSILSNNISSTPKISKYLEKSTVYEYKTSITGKTGKNADVYKSSLTIDSTAKDIIRAIDGKTDDVQQNTEDGDNSIGILTEKEYCYIYESEDDEVLVQISSREYAYSNDSDVYRGRSHSSRYYRRYYYSRGYKSDSTKYDKYSSPYTTYTDSTITPNSSDTYRTYSSSVRQTSTSTRTSSGGGICSGK